MLRHDAWQKQANVSEERTACIFRVKRLLTSTLKMEAAGSCEIWYLTIRIYGVTSQKIFTTVRTPNLIKHTARLHPKKFRKELAFYRASKPRRVSYCRERTSANNLMSY
jgi:hypothetical protein